MSGGKSDAPSSDETQIAQDMGHVLDHLSRVMGAIEGGSWPWTFDKIQGLKRAVGDLATHVEAVGRDAPTAREPRPAQVIEGIRFAARHYWAGAMLYPEKGRLTRGRAPGGPKKSPGKGGPR